MHFGIFLYRFIDHVLFENIDFEIKRGEHVAIIGDNGSGKTTILKMINDLLTPDSGTITLGTNVEIGYYDQKVQYQSVRCHFRVLQSRFLLPEVLFLTFSGVPVLLFAAAS